MFITVELMGEPRGKGRPRFVRATGRAYTPQRTSSYEACLKHEAAMAMGNKAPLEGALRVRVEAHFATPQSWSKRKRLDAGLGFVRPTKRPDWENVAKMLDAFNGVVWIDDAQVVEGTIVKYYSEKPKLKVEVAQI